jgi:four helix bundle protein
MAIRSFRDLEVWQLSMQLAEAVYALVRRFPSDERFGLASQLKRSAVLIPSNIAEGAGYGRNRRYIHHLRIALGSEAELQTQLELAQRLNLVTPAQVQALIERASEVGRMLNGLLRSLEKHREQAGL